MGAGIRVPDETFIKAAFNAAEDALLKRAGYCFLLEIERSDEAGFALAATRNDGARARFDVDIPRKVAPEKLTAFERVRRDRQWFKVQLNSIVESLCLGIVEDEPEAAAQAEPEQRFAVVLTFGSRPDVVLTPAAGVPADEATRVYWSFIAAASAIGGRPAMLPLGA
ncbi:hypothetical protein G4G93_07520 [Methylobacterium sp. DB0501]|uniref:Uncharacterized protein n=2 Tax=Methylobacterium TaxID=407 RepID=A0A2R4WRZ6_9HYPH|nr:MULTISPECIES: hypothetical protein [Methylobacterium]AWB24321.1 hypothetical protein DA075_28465 [Methylobacterium currus]NGM33783.1 hypothetical protein [Methylobacterium sp. DB0501]